MDFHHAGNDYMGLGNSVRKDIKRVGTHSWKVFKLMDPQVNNGKTLMAKSVEGILNSPVICGRVMQLFAICIVTANLICHMSLKSKFRVKSMKV